MKNITKYFVFALLIGISGCFENEEFSDIPRIAFDDIRFVDTDVTDSLILSFTFEDENADIGLSGTLRDISPPYHIYDVIIDANETVITISQDPSTFELPLSRVPILFVETQDGQTIFFGEPEDKMPFSSVDNRPPYDCANYEIVEADTFYIQRNEFRYNFYVTFEQKVANGYEEVNFREIFDSQDCSLGDFNGRIPFFDREGRSGVFSYAMLSQALRLAFADNTIRLRFFVYDRALNKSNEVVTPDFRLSDITQ